MESRAERMAKILFERDYHDGHDCRNERDREGLPCNICADQRAYWLLRVAEVQAALDATEAADAGENG
jgi:hypothetical protein